MPTASQDNVRETLVSWSILTVIEILALVRVPSLAGWNPSAVESLMAFTKSPITKDGKSLVLGGQGTVKGTLARHLPHVSDQITDRKGEDKNGRKYSIVHKCFIDGAEVPKATFLKVAAERIAAANDEALSL